MKVKVGLQCRWNCVVFTKITLRVHVLGDAERSPVYPRGSRWHTTTFPCWLELFHTASLPITLMQTPVVKSWPVHDNTSHGDLKFPRTESELTARCLFLRQSLTWIWVIAVMKSVICAADLLPGGATGHIFAFHVWQFFFASFVCAQNCCLTSASPVQIWLLRAARIRPEVLLSHIHFPPTTRHVITQPRGTEREPSGAFRFLIPIVDTPRSPSNPVAFE